MAFRQSHRNPYGNAAAAGHVRMPSDSFRHSGRMCSIFAVAVKGHSGVVVVVGGGGCHPWSRSSYARVECNSAQHFGARFSRTSPLAAGCWHIVAPAHRTRRRRPPHSIDTNANEPLRTALRSNGRARMDGQGRVSRGRRAKVPLHACRIADCVDSQTDLCTPAWSIRKEKWQANLFSSTPNGLQQQHQQQPRAEIAAHFSAKLRRGADNISAEQTAHMWCSSSRISSNWPTGWLVNVIELHSRRTEVRPTKSVLSQM